GNVGLGIDLRKTIPIEATEAANTPTPNDAGDPDTGNNNLQNFPVITGVTGRTVNFTFNSRPNTNFVLDFYSNAALDTSLHGEGETRIGSLRITTNDSGNSPVTSFTAVADLAGFVTATATNVTTGDTSEFSAGRRVVTGPPSLSIRNITAHEGNTGTTNAVFTVTLSAASTQPVRVDFLTQNGTAKAPADYTALPVTTLTIPAGSTTATITVAVKGDTIDEPDETFFVKITASSNATIADDNAFALIIDDDTSGSCSAPPTGLMAWYPAEGNANDIAGNNNGTATTDVTYPTAKVGKGFDFVDGSVRVPDVASLRPTTLTAEAWVAATAPGFKYILAKSLDGGRATYAFYTSGGGLRFYVKTTVAGNGGPGAGDVWLSPGASSAIWDGNPHHIAGTFDGSTVRLFVDGVQVGSGTATQGTLIYGNTYQNGDLFIGNYNPTGSFAWPGVIDEMSLYNRALSTNEIQAIFNAGSAGKCRSTTATPALSINDVSTTEGPAPGAPAGTKTLSFAVTLSQASTQTVTVNYATANGITNPAIAGSDYVAKTGTLTFAPGVRTQPIAITINGDTDVEQNETFFVNLSSASTNATITKARGIGTITNDDNVQAGSLQFSSPTYSVSESGPVATLSVTRTGGTGVAVGVSYAITNGTAVAPGDYTTKTGTLSWAIGDSAAKTIAVPIIDDALVEGNETFSVTLSTPTGGALIGTPNRAVVTITNNDSPPPVGDGGPLILMGIDAEDGGAGGHGPIANYVSVVNSILGKVTNGGQGILVIGGGKNATDDVTEFWNAIAAGTGKPVTYVNGATNIAARSFAGFAMIAVVSSAVETSGGGLTQAENDALATRRTDVATFVNTGGGLLGFSQSGLTTLYPYIEGFGVFTFNTRLDYSNITPTPAGQAIGITDALDVFAWHDEYLTFPAFLGILATNAATDKAAAIGGASVVVGSGIRINDVSTTEGPAPGAPAGTKTLSFAVTLSQASTQTVTVNYATANGITNPAIAGSDYVAKTGTLTFAPGVRTQPIAITINGDTDVEQNETFFVNLSNPVNATISDARGVGTITNDDTATGGDPLLAWGYNDYGSVGDGTRTHRPSPVTVNIIRGARLIASGGSHNLAVAGNVLYAWGDNESGQLGDGTVTTRLEPVAITLPTGIRADGLKAIACGWYHSLAITADNRVLAWGLNKDGQCGVTPDGPRFVTTPRIVAGLANITQISGGTLHSLALDSSRRVWAWGNNFYGQLGNGTIENVKSQPTIVTNLPAVQAIGAGGGHSVALLSDGTARAWGWNLYGQLGDGLSGYTNDGQERRSAIPVVVKNVSAGTQLGVGYVHNLVRKSDSTLLSWGNNFYGQLGRSTTQTNAPLAAPVMVGSAAFNNVQSMAVGTGHNLVIRTDGTI
ncbi:MAG TPA: Calx-beta domain-containing protein, partial [Fibrella sp.]